MLKIYEAIHIAILIYFSYTKAKNSMSIVVMLGRLIHRLQMERDMSVLYLSDLGPGTKTFLLAEYMATDDALEKLTIWPGALQVQVNFI